MNINDCILCEHPMLFHDDGDRCLVDGCHCAPGVELRADGLASFMSPPPTPTP